VSLKFLLYPENNFAVLSLFLKFLLKNCLRECYLLCQLVFYELLWNMPVCPDIKMKIFKKSTPPISTFSLAATRSTQIFQA